MTDELPHPQSSDCQGEIHPEALHGMRLFNEGQYWHAHEALETAWRHESGQKRHLYRGILQVGVAYYHVQRRNYTGALKLYRRAQRWLRPFPQTCLGIDVEQLLADLEQVITEVKRLGPDRLDQFDPALLKPLHWKES
jgi:predicted metal-dependent hydrolase